MYVRTTVESRMDCLRVFLLSFTSRYGDAFYYLGNVCMCSSKADEVGVRILHHYIETPCYEELLLIDRQTVCA